jgi:hypothetical protein
MTRPETIITLTTDFGTRDCYVAAMKGVIVSINPSVHIVDLGHEIEPHNVVAAALFLKGSAPFFRDGTIHVVVVDPGVGTDRRALCIKAGEQYYIAPDNGVLSLVVTPETPFEAVAIENARYIRSTVSATFHGRDVFAPAAAHLSLGVSMNELGTAVEDIVRLELPVPIVLDDGDVEAHVIHIDRFGNLITNVDKTFWETLTRFGDKVNIEIRIGESTVITQMSKTYGDAPQGAPLALWGSSDMLEVSINQENAARELGVNVADKLTIGVR